MAISGVFLFSAKYANSWEMLIIGRLIIGINSGLNAGLAPMYLSEISPTALRGAVGTVYQLIITISILLSQILGMTNVLGNDAGWPFLLGLTVIPGVLQLITLPFCPESPKYLMLDKNDNTSANNVSVFLDFSIQGGPERSRQSNLAVFAVEGGLDSKFPHVK